MGHLQRVWLASRERLPLRTPGSVPLFGGLACALIVETSFPRLFTNLMTVPNLTFTELRGFHGAFATGVASQQGALTLPDTWFRPPFWDLLMLQLLRPNSSNLPCLYSTFHLEYPLVLSRLCLLNADMSCDMSSKMIGRFFRSYSELLSKLCEISFQEYVNAGISHPVFYGDLVYKLRRVECEANFVSSGSKIVKRLRRRKYDPVIINRTIGIVLGPSSALYGSFQTHCIMTNRAVGTIRRDFPKSPQRKQCLILVPSDC